MQTKTLFYLIGFDTCGSFLCWQRARLRTSVQCLVREMVPCLQNSSCSSTEGLHDDCSTYRDFATEQSLIFDGQDPGGRVWPLHFCKCWWHSIVDYYIDCALHDSHCGEFTACVGRGWQDLIWERLRPTYFAYCLCMHCKGAKVKVKTVS